MHEASRDLARRDPDGARSAFAEQRARRSTSTGGPARSPGPQLRATAARPHISMAMWHCQFRHRAAAHRRRRGTRAGRPPENVVDKLAHELATCASATSFAVSSLFPRFRKEDARPTRTILPGPAIHLGCWEPGCPGPRPRRIADRRRETKSAALFLYDG